MVIFYSNHFEFFLGSFLSKRNTTLHAQAVSKIEFSSFGWSCPVQFLSLIFYLICVMFVFGSSIRLKYCIRNINKWLCVLGSSIQNTYVLKTLMTTDYVQSIKYVFYLFLMMDDYAQSIKFCIYLFWWWMLCSIN